MNLCIANLLNRQIVAELDAAHLYMQMAEWMHGNGFPGPGGWLRRQANEEAEHAMTLFTFLRERGTAVIPGGARRRKHSFASVGDVTARLLAQGKRIAATIRQLNEVAQTSDDGDASALLAWFSVVQLAEEELVANVLLRVAGCCHEEADEPPGIAIETDMDPELAKLQATIPSLLKSQRRHGVA